MNHQQEVWIVDDDHAIRWVLERALAQADIKTQSFDAADKVIAKLRSSEPDAIITDIRMPGTDGLQLLEHVNELYPDLPVIIMTAYADLDRAVAAFQGGAFEYLPKPFDVDDAVAIVRRAAKNAPSPTVAYDPQMETSSVSAIIGAGNARGISSYWSSIKVEYDRATHRCVRDWQRTRCSCTPSAFAATRSTIYCYQYCGNPK
jgi:two-component system, NtrC family, nitrogen regulation response regulator GlnG